LQSRKCWGRELDHAKEVAALRHVKGRRRNERQRGAKGVVRRRGT